MFELVFQNTIFLLKKLFFNNNLLQNTIFLLKKLFFNNNLLQKFSTSHYSLLLYKLYNET